MSRLLLQKRRKRELWYDVDFISFVRQKTSKLTSSWKVEFIVFFPDVRTNKLKIVIFFLSQNKFQEELEQNKRRTERKMRNSLANIQFHEAQKQTLLGKMDFAENQ